MAVKQSSFYCGCRAGIKNDRFVYVALIFHGYYFFDVNNFFHLNTNKFIKIKKNKLWLT